MADFEVKVRNLETGEVLVAEMPDAESCIEWCTRTQPNYAIGCQDSICAESG